MAGLQHDGVVDFNDLFKIRKSWTLAVSDLEQRRGRRDSWDDDSTLIDGMERGVDGGIEQVNDEEDEEDGNQQLGQSSSLDLVDPSVVARSSFAPGIAEATAGVIGSVEFDAAAATGRPTASPKLSVRVYRQSVIFGRPSTLTDGDANALRLPMYDDDT